jgi:hypothetical protein
LREELSVTAHVYHAVQGAVDMAAASKSRALWCELALHPHAPGQVVLEAGADIVITTNGLSPVCTSRCVVRLLLRLAR